MKIGMARHAAPPAPPLKTGGDGNGNCNGNRNGNGHGDEDDDGGGDWNDDGNGDGNGNRNGNDPTESKQPEVLQAQNPWLKKAVSQRRPRVTPQRGLPLSTPQAPRKRKRHGEGASTLARLQEESHKFRTWPTSTKRVSRLGF
jgi:hypothetical protein